MFRFGLSEDKKSFQAKKFDGLLESESSVNGDDKNIKYAVVLDAETTGFDFVKCDVIEIAARKIAYNKNTGEIVWYDKPFEALQDVGYPLPAEIVKLTGLTDDKLKGHSIDWAAFDRYLDGASIIISHNASFDRPFVDKHSAASRESAWGCSVSQISWKEWFPSRTLQVLALIHGFFYDAHRALIDVDALITLLGFTIPEDESRTYLNMLLENARKPSYWVLATNSPYETKDVLKRHGYRWIDKTWRKRVGEELLQAEKDFLLEKVYAETEFRGTIEKISVRDNFKDPSTPSNR